MSGARALNSWVRHGVTLAWGATGLLTRPAPIPEGGPGVNVGSEMGEGTAVMVWE